jgi:hypothetical protein
MGTVVLYSLNKTPHPPPRIWAHIRGRNWSAKIDDISLEPPARNTGRYNELKFQTSVESTKIMRFLQNNVPFKSN